MELQLAYKWLLDNKVLVIGNVSFRDKIQEFFEAHNAITGDHKKVTTCGRCISNMKARLVQELIKLEMMNKYPVYRTAKGNLTLKEQGESIFTIRSSSKLGADAALKQLKAYEKRENKKIED